MRRRARLDSNHSIIVKELRQMGASVVSMAELGDGAPDIAVGWRGENYFFEIKDPAKRPSARKLTPDEQDFHESWRGQVCVIESTNDAVKAFRQ